MRRPAAIPRIIEYIGFITRNNIMHIAMPAHSDANLATVNGSKNITAMVMPVHIISCLFEDVVKESTWAIYVD